MYKILCWGSFGLLFLVSCQGGQSSIETQSIVSDLDSEVNIETASADLSPGQINARNLQGSQPDATTDLLRSLPLLEGGDAFIEATAPDDRLRQVQTGRSNPFATMDVFSESLDLGPLVTISAEPPDATADSETGSEANPDITVSPPEPISAQTSDGKDHSPAEVASTDLPTVDVPTTVPATVPTTIVEPNSSVPPSSPTLLAETIQIQGVMQVGDRWKAIVKDPNEHSSRTVNAGDLLAGGQVRVLQIEMTASGTPRVVLEQNGIEVIRTVS